MGRAFSAPAARIRSNAGISAITALKRSLALRAAVQEGVYALISHGGTGVCRKTHEKEVLTAAQSAQRTRRKRGKR
jgi:hypothetical protein